LLKDYFFAIVGAAVVALLLRVYVVEAFRIPTDFMAPMLLPGDHIFVNKLAYGGIFSGTTRAPARGDVVIFSFPNFPQKDYIKRVVALEGDTVEIRDSRVVVGGKPISREMERDVYEEELAGHRFYVQWKTAAPESRNMPKVTVPPGNVFVLGDNRAKGQDSRGYGFLPLSSIKGRAALIWFSTGATSEALGVRWSRLMTRVN
ncbi:MAG: signal peptidase I, partial [Deltaproteobacteria bacterium]|nr:signal peptidase I [Deltaproteobacteria bacterium]